MRSAYLNGGMGALVSGIIWLASGLGALYYSHQTSILFFFFAGMFIHPLGLLLSKAMGRSGKHNSDNPLATLALESTVLLFIGLFIAYCTYQNGQDWFYSIMLLTIGGRYLIFQSIYGVKLYWIFGGLLILTGGFCLIYNQAFHIAGIIGGIIEIVFSILLTLQSRSEN